MALLASRLPAKIKDFHGCAFGFTLLLHCGFVLSCSTKSAAYVLCKKDTIVIINSANKFTILAKFVLFNTLNQYLGLTIQDGKPTLLYES